MSRAHANGIEIEYEVHGEPTGRPLLLLRGLGTQMIHWDPRFCQMLVEAGHQLVIFDNRDVGLSTHLHDETAPSIGELLQASGGGTMPEVPYTLTDMASDVIGLMDALGLESAHLAGISMGGMIVQQVAILHGARVRSLTSIMSTTGEPGLPGPTPEAAKVLMTPAPSDRAGYIDHSVETARTIGSRDLGFDEDAYRELSGRVFDRAYDPPGIARQLAAITASGSRAEGLAALRMPTLVIHGDADPLVPPAGGEATARAVPGAHLETIPGMGHDIPPDAFLKIVDAIAHHTQRAEALRRRP